MLPASILPDQLSKWQQPARSPGEVPALAPAVQAQTTASGRIPLSLRWLIFAALALAIIACDNSQKSQEARFRHIGALSDADQGAEARAEAKQGWLESPESEWGWRYKAEYIRLLLSSPNHTDEAALLLKPALPLSFTQLKARYALLNALVALQRRRPDASQLLTESVTLARQEGDARTESSALNNLARLDQQRRFDLLSQSLTVARLNHLDRLEAITLNNLAYSMLAKARYADAVAYLLEAVKPERQAKARSVELATFGNLGETYLRLGDLDQALQSLRHAQSLVQPSDPADYRANVSMGLAKVASMQRDNKEAEKQFRNAFECVKDQPSTDLYVSVTQKLAAALITNNNLNEAELYNQLGYQNLNGETGSDAHIAWYYLNLARIADRQGHTSQAKVLFEKVLTTSGNQPMDVRWSAYAQLGAIEGRQNRTAAARRDYENALSMIEAMRSQQGSAEHQIAFLSELIRFYDQYVEFLIQQGRPDEALRVADSSRASVLTQGRISERQNPSFVEQLRAESRASGSQLLFYWLAPERSYVWLITPLGGAFQQLPGEDELATQVASYSKMIQSAKDPMTEPAATGVRLYDALIGPVAAHLQDGLRVIIVPDGALHGLNFETMLIRPPGAAAPHFWIQDAALSVAPSLGILLDKSKAEAHPDNALIIGNGNYSGSGWPNLSESKAEVENLKALFPRSKLLMQNEAVPESYRLAQPEMFSLIHISAHVEANEKSPLDSAIILSPGAYGNRQLYARDFIKTRPLTADLVTISGCNSAGKPLAGEGMVGFAWAAFQAGARNALTSLWNADDSSTTNLMQRFYTNARRRQMPYYQALREAKLNMLATSTGRKPYYWAPFQLYIRSLEDHRNAVLQAKR